jgi:hypothetical protein
MISLSVSAFITVKLQTPFCVPQDVTPGLVAACTSLPELSVALGSVLGLGGEPSLPLPLPPPQAVNARAKVNARANGLVRKSFKADSPL